MSREVKRVPLDFDHSINETWPGYLMPAKLNDTEPCLVCKETSGLSPRAQVLSDQWYGNGGIPFSPSDTGSKLLTTHTPEVRAFAERNVSHAPEYYGTGEAVIEREARRLIAMWNYQWCHHLNQGDVDALVEAGRLMDFTHDFVRGEGWKLKDPVPEVTAAQVNSWSLTSMGHDAINRHIVIKARCEREGVPYLCADCDGHGDKEAYPGQREEQEKWRRTDPPTGEGWQLWESISEGSPISQVFVSAEGLATWMSSKNGYAAYSFGERLTYEQAMNFVKAGSSIGSFVVDNGTGEMSSGVVAAAEAQASS